MCKVGKVTLLLGKDVEGVGKGVREKMILLWRRLVNALCIG